MAKEKQDSVEDILGHGPGQTAAPKEATLQITMKDLAALVEAAVVKSSEASANVLATALKDINKPYRDPNQDANDEAFQRSTRELEKRIRDNMRASQASCPHKQGCNDLSEVQGAGSSFVTHRTDTGMIWGVCTNCQKQIFSNRPEDARYFREKSGNRMSAAGQRNFMDTAAVQAAGMPPSFEEPENSLPK